MGAPRRSTYERALDAKEAAEKRGYMVQRVIIQGQRYELIFLGEDPADQYDLADMKLR